MKLFEYFKSDDELADFCDKICPDWTGGFSNVYQLDKDTVLKVTDDDCYAEFLKFINLHPQLIHLPKIYDIQTINNTHYVVMEKLSRHELFRNLDAQCAGWWEADPCVWKGLSESLDNTLIALEEYFNDNCQWMAWDLRDENLMLNKRGVLVITDPWAECKYRN